MHYESKVGHIGGCLSVVDSILVLFHNIIDTNDTFILSKGHAAGALYVSLWSIGKIEESDLTTFHRDNTLLGGHPSSNTKLDILFGTGSLGHGLSLSCGVALGWKLQNKKGFVYCMTSDGEWQEGSTWEALIFACHNRLDNLVVLIDHNKIQGFGSTSEIASMDPLWDKIKSFDIDSFVIDGHNIDEINSALSNRYTKKPKIIFLKTIKGNGISFMQNKVEWHYLPLTDDLYMKAKSQLESQ